MNIIFVTKKWVEIIGDAADLLWVESDMDGDYAIVLASEKNFSVLPSFVEADICRRSKTSHEPNKDAFSRARIPVGVVAAIFDFTEAESKQVGFPSGAVKG